MVSGHWKSFLLDWNAWSCIWVKLQVEGQGWPTPMQIFRESAEKTLEQKACRDGENSAETQEKGSASVFSGFSVTVWKTMLDRNLEKKRLIWPAGYLVHHERKPRNNSRQEPWGRNCSRDRRRILFTVLLGLLPHSSRDYLSRSGTTHSRLGSSTLIIDQKNAHRHTHRPVWRRKFLSWCFQLSVDSSLGAIDKN